jgi:peroxiredoxin
MRRSLRNRIRSKHKACGRERESLSMISQFSSAAVPQASSARVAERPIKSPLVTKTNVVIIRRGPVSLCRLKAGLRTVGLSFAGASRFMVTSLCLFTCALTLGQPEGNSGWQLAPLFRNLTDARGLELTYSGTYKEEDLIPGVRFQRSYRLETTAFVLENAADHWDIAFLTSLSLRSNRPDPQRPVAATPSSVRLEVGQVNRQGRLKGRGVNLAVAVDGPPTVEAGAFLELPVGLASRNQVWEVGEEGRPPRSWQVLGTELCNGTTCVKLAGQQQSSDWDSPRGDHTAWRRRDTLWLAPQLGIAYRVERVIERREPNRRDPTHRLEVRYDLDSRLRYPGKLFDDRRHEIMKALQFREDAAKALAQPAAYRPQIEILQKRIAYHLENLPPTPYRKAVVHLQGQLERAKRGDVPADPARTDQAPAATAVRVGQRAPDFVVTDLINKHASVRLYRSLGRPILVAFYNPATETGTRVLEFAKSLNERKKNGVSILAMAVTADPERARRQHAELKLPFTILDGQGLHATFAVTETPRLVVLDGDGIVRAAYTGWGIQTPREIEKELDSWSIGN